MSNLPAHVASRTPARVRVQGLIVDAWPVEAPLFVRIRRHFGPELVDVVRFFAVALLAALFAGLSLSLILPLILPLIWK